MDAADGLQELPDQRNYIIDLQFYVVPAGFLPENIGQGLSPDIFHDQKDLAILFKLVIESDDIGMHADSGMQSAFAVNAAPDIKVVGQGREDCFYGNLAAEQQVFAEIDRAGPALAEDPAESITVSQFPSDIFVLVRGKNRPVTGSTAHALPSLRRGGSVSERIAPFQEPGAEQQPDNSLDCQDTGSMIID